MKRSSMLVRVPNIKIFIFIGLIMPLLGISPKQTNKQKNQRSKYKFLYRDIYYNAICNIE